MQEGRQCNDIFKLMKMKQQTKPLHPSILYLLRISFKNKRRNRNFNFMLKKIYCQYLHYKKNSGGKKIIPYGNMQKAIKSARNNKYAGKNKIIFSFLLSYNLHITLFKLKVYMLV